SAIPQAVETPPAAPPSPPAVASDYVIAKGDTFSTVAKKFHVTVKALLDANPSVEPTKLKIGQPIHIPASSPATTSNTILASGAVADTSTNGQTYSVRSGDSLIKIAGQFGVSVKAIR